MLLGTFSLSHCLEVYARSRGLSLGVTCYMTVGFVCGHNAIDIDSIMSSLVHVPSTIPQS